MGQHVDTFYGSTFQYLDSMLKAQADQACRKYGLGKDFSADLAQELWCLVLDLYDRANEVQAMLADGMSLEDIAAKLDAKLNDDGWLPGVYDPNHPSGKQFSSFVYAWTSELGRRLAYQEASRHKVTTELEYEGEWLATDEPEDIDLNILKDLDITLVMRAMDYTDEEIAEHLNESVNQVRLRRRQAQNELVLESASA